MTNQLDSAQLRGEIPYPGFKLVDKSVFTAWLMGTTRNVHPTLPSSPAFDRRDGYTSAWTDLRTGEVLGYSNRTTHHLRESLISVVILQATKETA